MNYLLWNPSSRDFWCEKGFDYPPTAITSLSCVPWGHWQTQLDWACRYTKEEAKKILKKVYNARGAIIISEADLLVRLVMDD